MRDAVLIVLFIAFGVSLFVFLFFPILVLIGSVIFG
jgi:hypothetical protein